MVEIVNLETEVRRLFHSLGLDELFVVYRQFPVPKGYRDDANPVAEEYAHARD